MFETPRGMSRRHFMSHLAATSGMAATALSVRETLAANAETLRKNNKSAILLWMGGGPATIDLWDLKPGAPTGGEFKPIATTGEMQIGEMLPKMAQVMDKVALVRSMSTREADHGRGTYYMHTGYVPNPNVVHPSYGSVLSKVLETQTYDLEIPPFVSVGGGSAGPGFLGMAYAPFVVDSSGRVRNMDMGVEKQRLMERMQALAEIEKKFIGENRGEAATDHAKILNKTLNLMTSSQMSAFNVASEPAEVKEKYGANAFGQGCLMARRLTEQGVVFVEVSNGGWDNHQNIFTTFRTKIPPVDQAMAALIDDLYQRGRLQDTVVIWMGDFGRTPRINGNAGRDHWARSWSVMVGGGKIKGGVAVGATNDDGTQVTTEPYTSEDLMATVFYALGISLNTTFTNKQGRPMKIANGGKLIKDLFA